MFNDRPTGDNAYIVENLYGAIWFRVLKRPLDSMPSFDPAMRNSTYQTIREVILNGQWFDSLDLVEFIAQNIPENWKANTINLCNSVFEGENAAYRFINSELTEITDAAEIESIAEALDSPKTTINTHFANALSLLSDRKSPDYRNSIKESISAVESLCKVISGKQNGTLGECLKVIQNSHPMHKAFQAALNSLYGYTSDEGGIRHALTEDSSPPTYADAKFMLVSCTAFVNYLLTIAAEENISLNS
ncbi:hypothetical protein E4695_15275 [Alcaligenaceae bacterium 429]|nr:hypothetical protein E4695_15275 [Alcaligenaceae bacterium 429]